MAKRFELTVDYQPHTNGAILSGAGLDCWRSIRRACMRSSDEAYDVDDSTIWIPWTGFLVGREEIGDVILLSDLNVTVVISRLAEDLLRKAEDEKSKYKLEVPVDEHALRHKLSENNFQRALTFEQIRNVSFMASKSSAATFSVPGAGKTTEALAFYFYHKTTTSRLVVVAPKNAFSAWEEQLALCAPGVDWKVRRLRGHRSVVRDILDEAPDLILVNYQKFLNEERLIANYLAQHECFMFLDESHHIKKWPPGQFGSAILRVAHLPVRKLILTGTPLPNSSMDLIPQFRFLYPQISANEDNVVERAQKIFVRTTKKELGLKSPRISVVKINMDEGQRRLYELMSRTCSDTAKAFLKSRDRNLIRSLRKSAMRMLQLTSNPALLAASFGDFPDELRDCLLNGTSPKIQYACQRASELAGQGKKTVIWSSFVNNVESIALRLAAIGADYIHGGVDAGSDQEWDTREGKIKRFHDDPNSYVLVANPAACAEGISLHTVCHNAIYVDRTYNAAQYLQSQDRIHRLGLPEATDTEIEILICRDSVDESVERRLSEKVAAMSRVLNDPSLIVQPIVDELDDSEMLSDEDLLDFVSEVAALDRGRE